MANTRRTSVGKKGKLSRNPNQKKRAIQGHKSKRNCPETEYGELKKNRSFSLTDTATFLLQELSRDLQISSSELLERLARRHTELKALLAPSSCLKNSQLEEL